MPEHRIFSTSVASVYPLYVQKAERKGRTKEEVDRIIGWLTGYSDAEVQRQLQKEADVRTFFAEAPAMNPNSSLIKGVVCGVRVEEVEDPLMRKIRYLDKLVDELAKGKPMEKILREGVSTMAGTASGRQEQTAPSVLLSGGNPQIAKGDGDAPVQAYIAAMPGWKSGLGRRLDDLIVRSAPEVRKGVRWNSPFYGVEGQGWFLSYHCFTKFVKVTFFNGAALRPMPPGESKHENVRYLDIHEDDELDEAQFAAWVKQASELPGWGGA